eukprot:CAMPEP_0168585866 /NCGR_PEP_ID=MMETSP0420-20121227/3955_1 /TAXON_ID=498008 /ORGANISM="Pessonella sp." /LENGTH=202 /DNA_ID=CAMNT_0008620871 /DNA_START=353 /DNA_END=962 /DNA_ORIENTATION=+
MSLQELFEFIVLRPDVLGDNKPINNFEIAQRNNVSEQELEEAKQLDETNAQLNSKIVDEYLERMQNKIAQRKETIAATDITTMTSIEENVAQQKENEKIVAENVFMHSFIPRNLDEVSHVERDIQKLKTGAGKDLIYGAVTGVVAANDNDLIQKQEEEEEEETDVDRVHKKDLPPVVIDKEMKREQKKLVNNNKEKKESQIN